MMELDSTKFSVAPPHEDKGAEETAAEVLDSVFGNKGLDLREITSKPLYAIYSAMEQYASNERNRILKIAESISFNTEDQAGNKFVVVDLEELREKLKT